MQLTGLRVRGYRSIVDLALPLKRVNVIVGPNGCGKTNLYRSLVLLGAAARGQLARTLAAEGGMPSALWAGDRSRIVKRNKPVRLRIEVRLEDGFEYELACGLPPPGRGAIDPDLGEVRTLFSLDPEVKEETLLNRAGRRAVKLLQRKGPGATLRDESGKRVQYPLELGHSESVLAQLSEPYRYPELCMARDAFRGWRFYHQFRTDHGSPIREPQVAIQTEVLADDGVDLVCALQTIVELGLGREALEEAIAFALPQITAFRAEEVGDGRLRLALEVAGLSRRMDARELSDGTLRYLCLVAALMSPRPPSVLALNEPETSLHPDLIAPLAGLLAGAAEHSQIWVTTHSRALAARVEQLTGEAPIELEMVEGETRIAGTDPESLLLW